MILEWKIKKKEISIRDSRRKCFSVDSYEVSGVHYDAEGADPFAVYNLFAHLKNTSIVVSLRLTCEPWHPHSRVRRNEGGCTDTPYDILPPCEIHVNYLLTLQSWQRYSRCDAGCTLARQLLTRLGTILNSKRSSANG